MKTLAFLLLLALPAAAAEKKAVPAVPDVDLLALDLEMARFLVKHVEANLDPEARVDELMNAVFAKKKGLGITYEDTGTKTAVETFRSRSGNCLSFTILFVALARHLGLNAYFREVEEVMSWNRRGDVVLRNHHMFVEVEIENGHMEVDFLPGAEKRYRTVRRADERRVLAHYYNNLGVEKLAAGDVELALPYFEKAVAVDPSFAYAWTNRGVAWRHLGDFERAERSHRRALEIEPGEPTAVTNLASLYLTAGRRDEAAPLLAQVDDYLRRNPFHHFRLGAKALRDGDAEGAIRHFKVAIRRLPEEPEFHEALARALAATGDLVKARESFEKALELTPGEEQRKRLREELRRIPASGDPP